MAEFELPIDLDLPNARDVRRRWRFRLLEHVVAWSLYWMALLAHRDGDRHELHHIDAQLLVGDTLDCGPDCVLHTARAKNIRWSPPHPSEIEGER